MNIVIDGPEKAGKTTLITRLTTELRKWYSTVEVIKWSGRAEPDDRIYSDDLQMYASSPSEIAIWDRSWASEYVYGKLLKQDRRLALDPWLGAWLHDRAVIPNGLRVMMLGTSAEKLASLRDSSDLDVNPKSEIQLYKEYAERFGWLILEGYKYTATALVENTFRILHELELAKPMYYPPLPPLWSGPRSAEVVFVGSMQKERYIPGGWLPFTSKAATMFGRLFGDKALQYAWITTRGCNPAFLRNRKIIVVCGTSAKQWIQNYVADKENTNQKILYIPHPSFLFMQKSNKMILTTLQNLLLDKEI